MTKKEFLKLIKGVDDNQELPFLLVLDKDDSDFDIPCDIQNQGAYEEREILILPILETNSFDEEKIRHYLQDSNSNGFGEDKISIILDINKGFYIEDSKGNLLREVEFQEIKKLSRDSKIKELIKKLLTVI